MSNTQPLPEDEKTSVQPVEQTPEKVTPPEAVKEQPKATKTRHIEIFRGGLDGLPRTHLKNGAESRVERVNVPGFIETVDNQMKATDEAMAAEAKEQLEGDEPNRAVEVIEDQLQNGMVEGSLVLVLSEIFRSFGRDIFTIPDGGIDMSKLGNQIDVANKAKYVIPASRGEQMKSLLENMPAGIGQNSGSFHIENTNTIDPSHGFEAVYRYQAPNGEEIKAELVFFYAEEKEVDVPPPETPPPAGAPQAKAESAPANGEQKAPEVVTAQKTAVIEQEEAANDDVEENEVPQEKPDEPQKVVETPIVADERDKTSAQANVVNINTARKSTTTPLGTSPTKPGEDPDYDKAAVG